MTEATDSDFARLRLDLGTANPPGLTIIDAPRHYSAEQASAWAAGVRAALSRATKWSAGWSRNDVKADLTKCLHEIIADAKAHGMVVTVALENEQPPRMGGFKMRADIRDARGTT